MHVLIDDIRTLEGMDVIIRNPILAIDSLILYGHKVTHLYLDHDLGADTLNGYQVMKKLLDHGFRPLNVQIVSSNPVGRDNIKRLLIDHGYKVSLDGINFKR